MIETSKKALPPSKIKPFLITAIVFVLWGVLLASLLSYHFLFNEIGGEPKQNGAVTDISGLNLSQKGTVCLDGDWEFFYDKWLITDNLEDAEPDLFISLPGRWTGKTVNGEKLKRYGYASLRLKILNPPHGISLAIHGNTETPYRTYVNGKLNASSGDMSKTEPNKFDYGKGETTHYTVMDETELEIIVEISYTLSTTPVRAPVLTLDYGVSHNFNATAIIVFIAIGMIVACAVFNLAISMGLPKKEQKYILLFTPLSLLVYFVSSWDFKWCFAPYLDGFNFLTAAAFSFPSIFIAMVTFALHLFQTKLLIPKKSEKFIYCAALIAVPSLYYALAGTSFQVIAMIAGVLPFIYMMHQISRATAEKKPYSSVHGFMLFTLLVLFFGQFLIDNGYIVTGLSPFPSVTILLIVAATCILSYRQIRNTAKAAIAAAEFQNEISAIKKQALKAQIKPHFIFNVLSTIQELYRKDAVEGEKMITHFSKHLRANVDSDEKSLIPFEDELDNMLNYFELENLRHDDKLKLILNISYVNFSIPALSLQPFLENAVKYAYTQAMENGYIQISSSYKAEKIIVKIEDNGCGFDVANVRDGAVGIKNAADRLKYELDAEVYVTSKIGAGTEVLITFFKGDILDRYEKYRRH